MTTIRRIWGLLTMNQDEVLRILKLPGFRVCKGMVFSTGRGAATVVRSVGMMDGVERMDVSGGGDAQRLEVRRFLDKLMWEQQSTGLALLGLLLDSYDGSGLTLEHIRMGGVLTVVLTVKARGGVRIEAESIAEAVLQYVAKRGFWPGVKGEGGT